MKALSVGFSSAIRSSASATCFETRLSGELGVVAIRDEHAIRREQLLKHRTHREMLTGAEDYIERSCKFVQNAPRVAADDRASRAECIAQRRTAQLGGARGIALDHNQHAIRRQRGMRSDAVFAAGCANDKHSLRASSNTFVHRGIVRRRRLAM